MFIYIQEINLISHFVHDITLLRILQFDWLTRLTSRPRFKREKFLASLVKVFDEALIYVKITSIHLVL